MCTFDILACCPNYRQQYLGVECILLLTRAAEGFPSAACFLLRIQQTKISAHGLPNAEQQET